MAKDCILRVENIHKYFGPTHANNDITLEFSRGEIHGIIGENGSGKSTLSSIICGIKDASSGQMFKEGEPYCPANPLDAINCGVSMVVQELGVINNLRVPYNIFMGKEKQFSKFGVISRKKMRQAAQEELSKRGFGFVDVDAFALELSIEHRKLVELTKALMVEPEILVLDEITQALSRDNLHKVHDVIKEFAASGKTVIVITHDIEEIAGLADRITVLRDGQVVNTVAAKETTADKLKSMMIGRDLSGSYYREDQQDTKGEKVLLSVKDLNVSELVNDVSFDLYEGEVLAFCGLSDAGIHDLGEAIYKIGDIKSTGSVMTPQAQKKVIKKPKDIVKAGGAYLSKDRDHAGLMVAASIKDNMAIPSIYDLGGFLGLVKPKDVKDLAQKAVDSYDIKCRGYKQHIRSLSGGNKQKVNLSRWLIRDLKFLILDCPTRGVDVRVKAYIYSVIEEAKRKGIGIILISDELPEAIGMADRILVMRGGKIERELLRSEGFTEESIIEVMI